MSAPTSSRRAENFRTWRRWILDLDVDAYRKALLHTLLQYVNVDGHARVPNGILARESGLSRRAAGQIVAELVERGILKAIRISRGGGASIYGFPSLPKSSKNDDQEGDNTSEQRTACAVKDDDDCESDTQLEASQLRKQYAVVAEDNREPDAQLLRTGCAVTAHGVRTIGIQGFWQEQGVAACDGLDDGDGSDYAPDSSQPWVDATEAMLGDGGLPPWPDSEGEFRHPHACAREAAGPEDAAAGALPEITTTPAPGWRKEVI